MKYDKIEIVQLKASAEIDEKWVQAQLAEDPSILGLGDLTFRQAERREPRGGRLDLLMHDDELGRRYVIELQLGSLDESHIVRTIEYWDIEKKRNPQYEHVAVIIAEEITSRFLNVISLMNGAIPILALQLKGIKTPIGIGLFFTKVLDETRSWQDEEDDFELATTDRGYWEKKASPDTVKLADGALQIIKEFLPKYELKYNKHYIGLASEGIADNFILFRPKKDHLRIEIRLKESDLIDQKIEKSGIPILDYDKRWGRYRLRASAENLKDKKMEIEELFKLSKKETDGTEGN